MSARMTRNGPRIGVTSGTDPTAWRPGGPLWEPYAAAIRAAGGVPVHVGAEAGGRERDLPGALDGLLLTGGLDVDVRLYPCPPDLGRGDPVALMRARKMTWDPRRDAYELPLVRAALEADLPLLGICRGCQVLNVALGGRLVLDIPSEIATSIAHSSADRPAEAPSARHAVEILPGTRLAGILPPDRHQEVNSRHHQAVRVEEAFPARAATRCPEDGVVEAIEIPDRRWVIGVQWHPEREQDPEIRAQYRPVFEAFIAACQA